MKVTIWKNFGKRKGLSISKDCSPIGLVEIWNSISNMGNLKSDAVSDLMFMRASRMLRLSIEAGATPFNLTERKGYQIIQAEVEL